MFRRPHSPPPAVASHLSLPPDVSAPPTPTPLPPLFLEVATRSDSSSLPGPWGGLNRVDGAGAPSLLSCLVRHWPGRQRGWQERLRRDLSGSSFLRRGGRVSFPSSGFCPDVSDDLDCLTAPVGCNPGGQHPSPFASVPSRARTQKGRGLEGTGGITSPMDSDP